MKPNYLFTDVVAGKFFIELPDAIENPNCKVCLPSGFIVNGLFERKPAKTLFNLKLTHGHFQVRLGSGLTIPFDKMEYLDLDTTNWNELHDFWWGKLEKDATSN